MNKDLKFGQCRGKLRVLWSPDGRSFLTDSSKICKNEIIIRIENTRIPRGSRRRRPTGNLKLRDFIFRLARRLVVQIIIVHKKSKAESVREAIKDRECVDVTAIIFAIKRSTFANTLI